MDYAVRYGEHGTAVDNDQPAGWVQEWVDDLKMETFLDLRVHWAVLHSKIMLTKLTLTLTLILMKLKDVHHEFNALISLKVIYLLAKDAAASESDYQYVLRRDDISHSWIATVNQLLVACIKWKKLGTAPLSGFAMLREMTDADSASAIHQFVTELVLDTTRFLVQMIAQRSTSRRSTRRSTVIHFFVSHLWRVKRLHHC
ncbi:Hypothetical protein, putative [Bodo saltans]|uniref:Uncharacterized protein n=1 Tax=Bodo saltans TaxID=75058 RepID=A0A0S4JIR1_BODSA|nr:Hypothetical protein, putative [Bodo saltans]|eukprot:CUG89299.1 Hypothetical protein, putative [Bodo saltans]